MPSLGQLSLTDNAVLENTAPGVLVGALQNTQSGSTFAIIDTAGTRFALSGTNINTGATATNFETATTHNITVRETNAAYPNSPRDSVIAISVTNVFEAATLAALTLSDAAYVTGTGESGAINGATSGSTITSGSLPAGFTINGAARTWAWDGTGSVSTPSITLTETLADSANSPRQSVIGLAITAPAGVVINPPILALSSFTTYPPPLSVSLDETVIENDVLRVQSSASVTFASPIINDTSVLDAAAIASGNISVTGLSSITSPTQTYFRARVERGGDNSAYSTIIKHGDTVAPTITSSASPSVVENTVSPTGTLTADEDIASWTIVGGADAAAFDLAGNVWTLNVTPNFEVKTSYVVMFRATDYGGNFSQQTMTLSITDVDETPNPFSFVDVLNATLSTVYTSNTLSVAGLAASISVPVSIVGGTYSKNGGAFGSAPGAVTNGDTLAVRTTSSALNSTTIDVVLTVGTGGDTFSVVTEASGALPSIVGAANPARQNIGFGSATATFASQSIGVASTTRTILVVVDYNGGGGTVTGVTVGGVALTLRGNSLDQVTYSGLITTGTSADIVVTANSTFADCGIMVVALYDVNATPTETQHLPAAFHGAPHGVTVTTPATGFSVISVVYGGVTAPTWDNATELFTRTYGGGTTTLAYSQTSGFKGVSGVGGQNSSAKSVSYQP